MRPPVLERTLKERGHPDYAVEVLERTGHGMLVTGPDAPYRPMTPRTQAREYFELLGSWLADRGFGRQHRGPPRHCWIAETVLKYQ